MRNNRLARALLALTVTGLAAACDSPTEVKDPCLADLVAAAQNSALGPSIRAFESANAASNGAITASGRIYSLSGVTLPGMRATIDDRGVRTSANVASDGSFTINATTTSDTIDIIVDAAVASERTVHPALIRYAVRNPVPDLRFVMVPLRWTIAGGTYAGRTFDISVDTAFTPPCTTVGDTNCDGFYPNVWNNGFRLWPDAAYPIRIVFDHERSTTPITAEDSIAFWNIVKRMNDDFGTPMFRAARSCEVTFQADGRPNNAVSVRVDGTLQGFAAWTNWWWNNAGDMYSGLIRPRTNATLRSSGTITHELLHTQGFKHTCAWPTVMGGYGCSNFGALSPQDVAYAQLALEIADRQNVTGASNGLVAARNGQRVLMRGKAPIMASSMMASLRGGDSIGETLGDQAGDHARETPLGQAFRSRR